MQNPSPLRLFTLVEDPYSGSRLVIIIYTLPTVCMFVCYYPINVKTAELIRPKVFKDLTCPQRKNLDFSKSTG